MGLIGGVAITGLGAISALGCNFESHYRRLVAGEPALSEFALDGDLPVVRCAPVNRDYIGTIKNRMLRKLLQPSAAMAVVGAGDALKSARLSDDREAVRRAALYFGSVSFELAQNLFTPAVDVSLDKSGRFDFEYFAQRGLGQLDPLLIVKGLPNAGLCGVAIEYGALGPNLNITNGSIGGMQAIVEAAHAVLRGEAPVVIVAGYDSLLQPEHIAEQCAEGRHRILGEGAAVCTLEPIERARKRGVPIYAVIVAAAECASQDAGRRRNSLQNAGRRVRSEVLSVDPSCSMNIVFGDLFGSDEEELTAVQAVLGERGAITGHTGTTGFQGAAHGVFSLIHAAMSLRSGILSPAVGGFEGANSGGARVIRRAEANSEPYRLVWHGDSEGRAIAIVLRKAEAV
jgi:3-oxoacyl-[acyl-carrier-protein] synthase II